MSSKEPDYWKKFGAEPRVVAAADQADMEAGEYVDKVVTAYKAMMVEMPGLPLAASAVAFHERIKAGSEEDLYFIAYVLAAAVKKLAEVKDD